MGLNQAGRTVVVLGTGGTIAGVSTTGDDRAYQAAQLSVSQLVEAVPSLAALPLEAHQVAQIDSKDMGWPVWRALLLSLQAHLPRPEVAGVVVTHGTDTLEETALLLHLLLAPGKPVLLTAAMRPATSVDADGPANLLAAVRAVAGMAGPPQVKGSPPSTDCGVGVMVQGRLWSATDLRKVHSWHIDAFDGGGEPPVAVSTDDGLAWSGKAWPWPQGWLTDELLGLTAMPRVEVVTSHADADGAVVDGLLALGPPDAALASDDGGRAAPAGALRGLVVACTGHGTLHHTLQAALERAQARGVAVWRSTRVARGGVAGQPHDRWPTSGRLTPSQARVALSLALAVRPDLVGQGWESWCVEAQHAILPAKG